ncbi:MAG: lysophospholipid acyltransferase family protein [Bacteroidales bacterium]|nr:lysophospholipid acyltransferase family protein [Bacteroidales bacterium]
MGYIGFYIFYGINWIITLLPLRVLYLFSDILFILLCYFPSYRRKIVLMNLRNSFPEKTEKELSVIARKFYRHLSDLVIEALKLTHMSNQQLLRRVTLSNPELLERLYNEGRDLMVVHSHYNTWEWLLVMPLWFRHKVVGVYKPLQNPLFNRFLNNIREKNNSILTPMSEIVRVIIRNRNNNIRSLYALMADQTPAKSQIKYRTTFLNQDTPVFLGPEKIAVKYDMAVIFFNMQKVRRGYYNLTAELLFEKTAGLPEYLVTETHVKRLEELIREKPEHWIWSHRRWKY